jgi:ethanolamine transporter EutH
VSPLIVVLVCVGIAIGVVLLLITAYALTVFVTAKRQINRMGKRLGLDKMGLSEMLSYTKDDDDVFGRIDDDRSWPTG